MSDVQPESNSSTDASSAPPTHESALGKFKPLRIWPAVVLIAAMVAARFLPTLVEDGPLMLWIVAAMGPMVLGGFVMVWWLTFSRASMSERIFGFIGTLLVAGVSIALSHKTMRGPGTMMMTIPLGTAGFAIAAIVCSRYLSFKRTLIAVLMAACGFGFTALLRSDGMWGHFALDWHWRWELSSEEEMLADRNAQSTATVPEISAADFDAWLAEAEWPRFRGPDGLSQQHGSQIATDWSAGAERLWRISVGPGWSSFAVAGNLLFTQEQRGQKETVVCYAADSGAEIWAQQIESRFDDPLGGPGPRATPTLADGGLFVQGANGQVQRLDPKTGDVVWVQDLREVAGRKPPTWGFCSSPLVVGAVVVVHAGGEDDKGTVAFDVETGDLKWSAAAGDHSYSSPQLGVVGDNELVLMLTNTGINLLDPLTGEERLGYEWEHEGYQALQPQVVDGDSILLPTGKGAGTRRIRITETDAGLAVDVPWTSRHLKPDFNDFVVYEKHAYGFDDSIFTCIDLASGKRKWKGGRYGKGQVLLLADSGILLVVSEFGDVVLLRADSSGHQELAKFRALEGKTWNHPVVIGDRLYIRNAREAACYRLPLATDAVETAGRIPPTRTTSL